MKFLKQTGALVKTASLYLKNNIINNIIDMYKAGKQIAAEEEYHIINKQ